MNSVVGEEEEKVGDDNTITSKAPQALHQEEDGALAPRRETLALLRGVPKDLTHQDLGTMHEQHVLSLPSGEILKIGGGRASQEKEHIPFSVSRVGGTKKARESRQQW